MLSVRLTDRVTQRKFLLTQKSPEKGSEGLKLFVVRPQSMINLQIYHRDCNEICITDAWTEFNVLFIRMFRLLKPFFRFELLFLGENAPERAPQGTEELFQSGWLSASLSVWKTIKATCNQLPLLQSFDPDKRCFRDLHSRAKIIFED